LRNCGEYAVPVSSQFTDCSCKLQLQCGRRQTAVAGCRLSSAISMRLRRNLKDRRQIFTESIEIVVDGEEERGDVWLFLAWSTRPCQTNTSAFAPRLVPQLWLFHFLLDRRIPHSSPCMDFGRSRPRCLFRELTKHNNKAINEASTPDRPTCSCPGLGTCLISA
jgi:hypothetical protein